MFTLKCHYCGKTFQHARSTAKYHSRECVRKSQTIEKSIQAPKKARQEEERKRIEVITFDKMQKHVFQVLKGQSRIKPKYLKPFKGQTVERAVLNLSDIHIGEANYWTDLDTGHKQCTYNSDIMHKQAATLVEKLWLLTRTHLRTYSIEELDIFTLGDLLTGELIFAGQQLLVEYGVGKQLIDGVKFICDLFREFLKMFKRINVVSVPGNHGRMTAKRSAAPIYNNFDYLLMKWVETAFANEPRIKFTIPDGRIFRPRVYDHKYLIEHGDKVKGWMGLPFYGIVRQSKNRRLVSDHGMAIIGHHHVPMIVPINRMKTMVNASWIRDSAYAWEEFGERSEPSTYFFGVSKKYDKTWDFELKLD